MRRAYPCKDMRVFFCFPLRFVIFIRIFISISKLFIKNLMYGYFLFP